MGKPLINLDYVWLTQLMLMVKGLFKGNTVEKVASELI